MGHADWRQILLNQDVQKLWSELYRLVSIVRASRFARNDSSSICQSETNYDLTQELFLRLFEKGRFQYYIDVDLSNDEIEHEIVHIEILNLLVNHLRKHYPESYRLARRISTLLQESKRFRTFDNIGAGQGRRSARTSKNSATSRQAKLFRLYGLREWPPTKPVGDSGMFRELIASVPFRNRDTRCVGCARDSQIIISNDELEKLLIEIFQAIDSPADVRTMRSLALYKIPVQDFALTSVEAEFSYDQENRGQAREIADARKSPEEIAINHELDQQARERANAFICDLRKTVRDKPKRLLRMLQIAWHCYFDPEAPSQLQIAEMLGISDTVVSDYRKMFECEARKVGLAIEQGAAFNEAVRKILEEKIGHSQL